MIDNDFGDLKFANIDACITLLYSDLMIMQKS